MRKSRFTEAQIVASLKELDEGTAAAGLTHFEPVRLAVALWAGPLATSGVVGGRVSFSIRYRTIEPRFELGQLMRTASTCGGRHNSAY